MTTTRATTATTPMPTAAPTEPAPALTAPRGEWSLLAARVLARAVDMFTVLFCTLAVILLGLASAVSALTDRFSPEPWGRAFAATTLYVLVATVYEVAFLVVRGQTPGKDLLNLRVVDVGTGAPPTVGGALRRTAMFAALRMVPGVALGSAVVLLLGAPAPFDARRRGLHDRLAGTRVEHYDADLEQGSVPTVDRATLSRTYGPRSIFDLVTKLVTRDDPVAGVLHPSHDSHYVSTTKRSVDRPSDRGRTDEIVQG